MPDPLHPLDAERRGLRGNVAARSPFRGSRPLDFVSSLKGKLGMIIVGTVLGSILLLAAGRWLGFPLLPRLIVSALAGLAVAQFLARGMISPLREMANATTAMARGDYSRRVRDGSRDEVGDLARAFNAMAGELAQVDRQRRDLVANVSHELRTPIGALRVLLENLVDGVDTPSPQQLETALAQTERLGRLVEQLLDLSRLESGGLAMRAEPFRLGPMLDQATREAMLADEPQARGVRVSWSVAPDDLAVRGDAERIHQVVKNLLDNAVRHSPEGGEVVVRATATDQPAGHRTATVEVIDEGPGIPADEVDRVFERFYRADRARSGADGGTGLGLAIARWIVDAHHGSIHATQAEPHGCRMVVRLPR
ncbi:MAG: ATP-binding protein [Patulibacter minatonensis]